MPSHIIVSKFGPASIVTLCVCGEGGSGGCLCIGSIMGTGGLAIYTPEGGARAHCIAALYRDAGYPKT